MDIQRFVGLAFSIGLLLLTLFVFLKPQIDYQQEQTIDLVNTIEEVVADKLDQVAVIDEKKQQIEPVEDIIEPSEVKSTNLDAMNIKKSDFDLFVLRVHVLSSQDNATAMVTKLQENGIIAFTEIFGEEKNLHAVYVGPFIDENDIHNNIELIQKVSETTEGEIFRWKL
ncbi:SPOR domain-containing protein [Gammaproteobacteria bacterium]|nr:SPOR domain-containing protein [Gammaproteobacteria bacterium]MDC1033716.1 SPOR domain-containing protein [bacterium]MDA8674428.1 SPOR domain-containing protein [Gammaproteobacteria bacterium]MDA8857514.1 SPOR domain-containing protein [Gammaproteobacteria bacterium]MDA8916573.1 SPOR domain-containing protein [Gammaproteobacteria bacterium]|tara:strand:+ start:3305 stop:3811 length:507 start_codon:yes stop_codon:yes gene_type:complete